MTQDDLWFKKEGDAWFERAQNSAKGDPTFDWGHHLIELLTKEQEINTVLDLGCADGRKLNRLVEVLNLSTGVGVDVSDAAIAAGKVKFPDLDLRVGRLSDIPVDQQFDLVVVSGVFAVVDRQTLAKSVAEVDRLTKDQGYLLLEDFLPDFSQRTRYTHCQEDDVFCFKTDHGRIFESLGIYKKISSVIFDADKLPQAAIEHVPSGSRFVSALFHKSVLEHYPLQER